jgi:O-antigen/teichoic acid export membrane protein
MNLFKRFPSSSHAGAAYIATFITEAAVAVGYLLAFHIVAQVGATHFAEYALARRTLSLLAPLAVIGLDLGIVRYISYALQGSERRERAYLGAGLTLLVTATLCITIVLIVFRSVWAALFFADSGYADLISVMPLLLLGTGLHLLAYGYLRGHLRLAYANALSFLNLGVVPVVAVIVAGPAVSRILVMTGGIWVLTSAAAVASLRVTFRHITGQIRELARYGIPRVPGDLMRLALFALPGILVAHMTTIREAGIVAFGVAALGLVGSALAPVSLVLLPYVSRYVSTGTATELQGHLVSVARIAIALLVVLIVGFELFARTVVSLFLGADFVGGTNILRVMMLGAFPWGIYIIFRSVIDAYHVSPINARNSALAFVVFVASVVISQMLSLSTTGVVTAWVAALYVLGAMTIIDAIRVVRAVGRAATLRGLEGHAG